jgi:hypothetical protein
MSGDAGEFEAGIDLVRMGHKRLSALDPTHELLSYGVPVQKGYVYDEVRLPEASKRFAKDGNIPRGTRACAYMLGQHFVALRDAAKSIESK